MQNARVVAIDLQPLLDKFTVDRESKQLREYPSHIVPQRPYQRLLALLMAVLVQDHEFKNKFFANEQIRSIQISREDITKQLEEYVEVSNNAHLNPVLILLLMANANTQDNFTTFLKMLAKTEIDLTKELPLTSHSNLDLLSVAAYLVEKELINPLIIEALKAKKEENRPPMPQTQAQLIDTDLSQEKIMERIQIRNMDAIHQAFYHENDRLPTEHEHHNLMLQQAAMQRRFRVQQEESQQLGEFPEYNPNEYIQRPLDTERVLTTEDIIIFSQQCESLYGHFLDEHTEFRDKIVSVKTNSDIEQLEKEILEAITEQSHDLNNSHGDIHRMSLG